MHATSTSPFSRMLLLFAVIGLAGCGGKGDTDDSGVESDTDTDTDADTDADTDVDTTELCDDGIDNDSDGLIDCEDGDCADDGSCVETDCADTVDNDDDGVADCADEDCWGNGCAVTIAEWQGASQINAWQMYRSYSLTGGNSCSGSGSSMVATLNVEAPHGIVRTMQANSPVWRTCTWTADSTEWSDSNLYTLEGTAVTRNGFNISGDCDADSSGALPQYLAFDYFYGSQGFPIRTQPDGLGAVWFFMDSSPTGYDSDSTGYLEAGSPCDIQHYTSTLSYTFGATPGAEYVEFSP